MIDENTARETVRAYEQAGERAFSMCELLDESFMEQFQVERMKLALEVGLSRKAENERDLADLLFTILHAQDVHLVLDAMGMVATRVALMAQPAEGKTRGEILNRFADHIKSVAARIDEPEETD